MSQKRNPDHQKTAETGNIQGRFPLVNDGNYPPPGPLIQGRIQVKNLVGARRLLSRCISAFCRGEMLGTDAKTLAYLLISYSAIVKDADIELRVKTLEERIGDRV